MRLAIVSFAVLVACAGQTARSSPQAQPSVSPALTPGPHDVVLNGVRFYYRIGGTASDGTPPVVFLHGGPGQGSEHFDVLGGRYIERDLRMVWYDQRGSGLSERPVSGDYAIATMVDDIEALRQALGVPQVALIGHSFGAVLALEYAAKYPHNASHVVIVAGLWDTSVQCSLRLARFAALRPDVYARARNDTLASDGSPRNDCDVELHARNGLSAADRRAFDLQTIFTDSALATRLDSVNNARHVVYGIEVNTAVMRAGLNSYRFTKFGAVTMPVLVIAGKRDGAAIPEGLRRLAEKLPRAQYVEFDHSGHFVYLDEPDRFAKTVSSFVRGQ